MILREEACPDDVGVEGKFRGSRPPQQAVRCERVRVRGRGVEGGIEE